MSDLDGSSNINDQHTIRARLWFWSGDAMERVAHRLHLWKLLYKPYQYAMWRSGENDPEGKVWNCYCICHHNTDSRVLCGHCQ